MNGVQNRFEMQGKESEKTFGLNLINFGARTYNPTIGRFDRVDPLTEKMRRYSPYNYNFNNPLRFIDSDGLKPVDIIIVGSKDFQEKTFQALGRLTNDKLRLDERTGKVTVDSKKSGDLKYGTSLIRHLSSANSNDITIAETSQGNQTEATKIGDNKKGWDSKVSFNPDKNDGGVNIEGKTERPVEIGLGHELLHASHFNDGKNDQKKTDFIDPDTGRKGELSREEIQTRKEENILRSEKKLPERKIPFKENKLDNDKN